MSDDGTLRGKIIYEDVLETITTDQVYNFNTVPDVKFFIVVHSIQNTTHLNQIEGIMSCDLSNGIVVLTDILSEKTLQKLEDDAKI